MARKWFQIVGEDDNAVTSTDSVSVDIEDVDTLRIAVKEQFKGSYLAGIAASDLTVFANRAAFDAKQKLSKSSSAVTEFGNDEDHALIVVVKAPTALRLTTQTSYPPFLKKAIEIANVMLTHKGYFELELSADRTTRKNLRDVKVEFRRPEKESLYGWSDRSTTAKVIFVNEVLLQRMETIDQADNSHEYQCIVFVVAATIFHECAHLALRWKNMLDSPSKYDFEVGSYMETKLFKGTCRMKLQQSTRAKSSTKSKRNCGIWTEEMPILDAVIDGKGLHVIRADHLNKFFTPGKLRDKALFPLELTTYPRTKGATALSRR
ncbi:hypothetical protein PF005_g12406 [Phytophthora fragariae]|uniref:CRN domain-containing protein-containing protein n=1 Tax=Phytophthora fragariae TaxID=53985 RepID=A0A6A3ZAZ7_9STRA|nr:hypothetical protein PF003_g13046 [Phytophthora fragariae]KAE8937032.1 hypothetical protein PF009_g13052 [Phytophthora fragariae]KAE9007725.1 hypothetical protein PF011_g11002 [Phytophthora fragariae]KAE9108506.1 hypothetical protein PF010_g11885 [Phytophthora fragariae]KAE9109833.1 hypothetical protein PF007_g12088 [Phytophthora fragariae]